MKAKTQKIQAQENGVSYIGFEAILKLLSYKITAV